MQRSGFSTAAAATAVPRAMTGPMTGRMAGTGAVSAGQVLAGARRNATTEVGQEGAYANLRQRTGELAPSSVYAKCCCRGVPSWGEGRTEADSFRVELGGLGRLRTNWRWCRLRRKSATRAAAPKVARFRRRLDVADPPSLPLPTLGPSLAVLFVYCTRYTRKIYRHADQAGTAHQGPEPRRRGQPASSAAPPCVPHLAPS